MEHKTIYIIDDEASVRKTLENVFRLAGFTVRVFDNPHTVCESPLETKDSCILLDLSMPEMSGLEFQQLLLDKKISIPIVFYSGKADVDSAVGAMKAGAYTLIRKPASNKLLIEMVLDAIDAHVQIDPFKGQSEQAFECLQALSQRELQVAELVADGQTASEIAKQLFISRRTVEAHRAHIFEKLKISSVARLAQLVLIAKVHLG
ncbi:MAG: FixJ family two-component response regulator [Alphaproteobacteria bacterium]